MRVYITGMFIPNTNMWEVEDDWNFQDLLEDVVKIITAKKGAADDFTFEGIDMSLSVIDTLEPNSEIKIIGRS